MEKIVYLRAAKSLQAIAAQFETLRAAGVTGLDFDRDRAYLDPLPKRRDAAAVLTERAKAILACRPGDELWVAFPAVLGASVDDALLTLEQITRRGAVLRIASTGQAYNWHPGAAEAVTLARQIGEDARKARTSKATEAAIARQARTRAQQKAAWAKVEARWTDPAYTVKQIEDETGIKARTMYRAQERGQLPQRSAQPFTGGPKVRRRGK